MKILLTCAALLAAATAQASTYYLTVAGLGGEPDFEQRFTQQAQELDKILRASGPDAKVETLAGKDATRDRVVASLQRVAKSATAQDSFVLTLIGHGTFDGETYKFNLPGPDISANELANLLDRIPTGRQLVVNTTSSSGACLAVLKKPNRAVITATRSGTEKNATVFARYWVDALRDPSADTDKNEVISALEAFKYADAKTKEFYDNSKRIATEHPALDDTGKGEVARRGSAADPSQGLLAARIPLLRMGSIQAAAKTPEKQKLLTKREDLERQIDDLKSKKAAMPNDQYRAQLSSLLLELAKTQAEIDR